jgi:hypothetical protein
MRSSALLALLFPPSLLAQATPLPAGWQARPDRPEPGLTGLSFETMSPGWHVTTGPAVILWQPDQSASGPFTLECEVFFFREGSRDAEAYGVLFGGQNLDRDSQEYFYFLLRNDGKYLVKHRQGADTHTITDWTAHPAIQRHTGQGGPTVKNALTVMSAADSVRLLVNGQQVSAYPAAIMKANGLVGLRVNHGLNLHVSKLEAK